MTNWTNVNDGV